MSDYDRLMTRLAELEPWMRFLIKYEGSEIGDYVRALEEVIQMASGMYDDHALKMVECLEDIVDNAKEESVPGGWVYDMIEQAQYGWEEDMEKFKPEHRPNVKSPMQELEELRK